MSEMMIDDELRSARREITGAIRYHNKLVDRGRGDGNWAFELAEIRDAWNQDSPGYEVYDPITSVN